MTTMDDIVYLANKARETDSIHYLKQLQLVVESEITFRRSSMVE